MIDLKQKKIVNNFKKMQISTICNLMSRFLGAISINPILIHPQIQKLCDKIWPFILVQIKYLII